MYTPDSSTTDPPLAHEALKLLSFYAWAAFSLAPNGNPCGTSPKSFTPNQSPSMTSESPKMTITLDASTNIIGHGNTIQHPSPATTNERIKSLVELALSRLPDSTNGADDEDDAYSAPSPMNVEVKVNAGVNICGSRNVMLDVAESPEAKKVTKS